MKSRPQQAIKNSITSLQDCHISEQRLRKAEVEACHRAPMAFHLMGSEITFFHEARCHDAREAHELQLERCLIMASLQHEANKL